MTSPVNPKTFGLHVSTRINDLGQGAYAIVIHRKSRIIMKDGKGILTKAGKIRAQVPGARVSVLTTAPVCSKTRAFLEENGIDINVVTEA